MFWTLPAFLKACKSRQNSLCWGPYFSSTSATLAKGDRNIPFWDLFPVFPSSSHPIQFPNNLRYFNLLVSFSSFPSPSHLSLFPEPWLRKSSRLSASRNFVTVLKFIFVYVLLSTFCGNTGRSSFQYKFFSECSAVICWLSCALYHMFF